MLAIHEARIHGVALDDQGGKLAGGRELDVINHAGAGRVFNWQGIHASRGNAHDGNGGLVSAHAAPAGQQPLQVYPEEPRIALRVKLEPALAVFVLRVGRVRDVESLRCRRRGIEKLRACFLQALVRLFHGVSPIRLNRAFCP
jgi:hypothetical protein